VVGKNPIMPLFTIPEGSEFFVIDDVIIESLWGTGQNPRHAQWLFDLSMLIFLQICIELNYNKDTVFRFLFPFIYFSKIRFNQINL